MKTKPPAVALTLVVFLCFFFGCAGTRGAVYGNGAEKAAEIQPATAIRPVQTADEPSNPLTHEEELLLEDDPGFGNEDSDIEFYSVADPLEKFNRAVFVFNDRLYFWALKPVALGYRAVVPQPARRSVKNFFYNIFAPARIVNNILQGKGQAAEAEWTRFLYNSTVGILGFGNPAARYPGLNPDEEDLGQTLAVYGIGDGFFIILPVLGASTLRDTIGMAGDYFLNPVQYVEPLEASMGLSGFNTINNISFRIGDYESLKKAALDPYESLRNAYIQLRQTKIKR